MSQNKLTEFWEQHWDKRFLDHFWPSRLYWTVLANLGHFGPPFTASTQKKLLYQHFLEHFINLISGLITSWRRLPGSSDLPCGDGSSRKSHWFSLRLSGWCPPQLIFVITIPTAGWKKGVKFSNENAKKSVKCMKYPPWDVIIWQILSRWYFQYTAPALTGDMAAIERVS